MVKTIVYIDGKKNNTNFCNEEEELIESTCCLCNKKYMRKKDEYACCHCINEYVIHFWQQKPHHRRKCEVCINVQHEIWNNHIINCTKNDCYHCDWLNRKLFS
jgi:hypothetical protein